MGLKSQKINKEAGMKTFGVVYGVTPRFETDGEAFGVGIFNEEAFKLISDDDLAQKAGVTIEQLLTEIDKSAYEWRTDQFVMDGRRVTFTYYGEEDDAEAVADWLNAQEAVK